MTQLDRQIRTAQSRLWLNRWLYGVTVWMTWAAAAYALTILVQRLFDLAMPVWWVGAGMALVAFAGASIWTAVSREDAACAAAQLDQAAGLRERISSGRYCQDASDPFAQAVVADAERIAAKVSARQHIRLTVPKPTGWAAVLITVSLLMFLIPPGLLKSTEAAESIEATPEMQEVRAAVKRKMDRVRQAIESTPALEEFRDDLDDFDKLAGGRIKNPTDLRLAAAKKIDQLADAIKKKRQKGNHEAVNEVRKMLRGLKTPQSKKSPTQKLAKSLAKGDFKTAKEELKKMREQLATLKSEKDKDLTAEMSKQLAELAKQIEKLAKNKKLAQKLKQAGIKKEDIKRMLENLKKKDLDQLKKQLEKNGMSQKEIKKLAKQLQKNQKAGSMAKNLSKQLQQGSKCDNPGQMGDAMAGLSAAAVQLSEMEQLEQEMNQLDSTLADLQNNQSSSGRPCGNCKGRGCSACSGKKIGGGMNKNMGKGRGGLAPEQQAKVSFKVERGKVHTGKGAIIGQFLFDGEQVKGEVSKEFTEVVTAAEHDASDRINRNRVPRQYHKSVKEYFSNVQRSIGKNGRGSRKADDTQENSATPSRDPDQGPGENPED